MEDTDALNVMMIMVAHGCRPGVVIPLDQARDWLIDAGLNDDEIVHCMAEAILKNWLLNETGTLAMTAAGAAAAKGRSTDLNEYYCSDCKPIERRKRTRCY